jgi:uncharacterized membrane protein YjfL (UPF0719 family)
MLRQTLAQSRASSVNDKRGIFAGLAAALALAGVVTGVALTLASGKKR